MDKIKQGQQQSLFSIQVDDVIIQRIFAGLQSEVNKLQREVKELREELSTKSSKDDITDINNQIETLKKESNSFAAEMRQEMSTFNIDISAEMRTTKEAAKKEITDAVFSLNNVVRAQNALIEEKIFELTKPTFEFTEMKHAVASVKSSHEVIELEMDKIRKTVASVLEVKSFDDISNLNLTKIIHKATQEDRDNIAHSENRINAVIERLENAETIMQKICRNPDTPLPQWQTVPKYDMKEKPKLPQLFAATTFYEYIEYLMLLAPTLQKIFSGFYKEITSLSNRIWENQKAMMAGIAGGEGEGGKIVMASAYNDEQIKNLINDVDELKLKAVSRSEFAELQDEMSTLKGTDVPKLKLNKLSNDIEVLSAKLASIDNIDEKMESMQKLFDTALTKAVRDVQSAAVSPGITPRGMLGSNFPAKTSVTPRGRQAHTLLYGEIQAPSTAQYPVRHADTRVERKPSIVTKPAVKKPESSLN